MCSVDLNMGTISGTTHTKTIFSFWLGTGKRFIGNTLYSSDIIYILHIFAINNVFKNPQEEKIQRS
jgi:glucuronate isomerase